MCIIFTLITMNSFFYGRDNSQTKHWQVFAILNDTTSLMLSNQNLNQKFEEHKYAMNYIRLFVSSSSYMQKTKN